MNGHADKATDAYAASYPRGPLLRPTSKMRAVAFMMLNLLAYAFATAFMHYIASGEWFSRTAADYHHSISKPLGQMLAEPLSVFTYPWMILVIGLLLAAVVIVPLLVACLYHSRYSCLFLLCVAVLAHSPVLTLVLAAGCVLVAATSLRRRNPSLALLGGLAPVGVYLYLSAGPSAIVTKPMEQLILYLPFVVAAAGALVAGSIALLIAHWGKYRPGVIWPVLTVLVVAPVWMFYKNVGGDELAFALLAKRLTPSETVFAYETFVREAGKEHTPVTRAEVAAAREQLTRRKAVLLAECDDFCKRYRSSRRVSAVLWIKGLTQDTRMSLRALDGQLLRYYDDVPLAASEATWKRLIEEHPAEPRAAVGYLRLARLAGTAGRIRQMRRHLDAGAALLSDIFAAVPQDSTDSLWGLLFRPDPGWPSRAYLQRVAHEIDVLRWLMDRNDVEADPAAAKAFGEYISLDSRQMSPEDFSDRIMQLLRKYVDTPFADNFQLADMRNIKNARYRAMRLKVLENDIGADASIEANFQLGLLAKDMDNVEGLGRILQRPEVYFGRVQSAPENPWQRQANEYLAAMKAQESAAP